MPSNRFFFDDAFVSGALLSLEDEEFRHAKNVMRAREGETVSLFNGKGSEAQAVIQSIEKRKISLLVQNVVEHSPRDIKLALGISLLRPGHLDFVVEKGTELGVDRFLLFPADFSERRECSPELARRLKAITVAALKQSGGLFLPELLPCKSLSEALSHSYEPVVWTDIVPEAKRIEETFLGEEKRHSLTVFIGPESGWSEKERKLFHNYGPPIRVHDTILRAETAGIIGAYAGMCWLRGIARAYGSA